MDIGTQPLTEHSLPSQSKPASLTAELLNELTRREGGLPTGLRLPSEFLQVVAFNFSVICQERHVVL